MHKLALIFIKQYITMKYAMIMFAPLNICGSGISFNYMIIRRVKNIQFVKWEHVRVYSFGESMSSYKNAWVNPSLIS